MKELPISKRGQISIPAVIRHRWGTRRILVEDRGDTLLLRPLPADPIRAARGSMRPDPSRTTSAGALRRTREEEARAKERRARR